MNKIKDVSKRITFVNPEASSYCEIPEEWPEIRKCPCCGGLARFKTLHAYWIECTKCGLSTPGFGDYQLAAKIWNGKAKAMFKDPVPAKIGRPMKGKTYAPKYVCTGRPPGRPRKYPRPEEVAPPETEEAIPENDT